MATRILVKPLRARFGKDGYPVWKTAQLEIQGPAGTGHPSATSACPIHESQPEQNLSFCPSIQGPDPWDHSTIGQSARGQWPCWRDRRGIDRALRLCSRGRGRRGRIECALLQDVHRGVEQAGRVVAAVWGQDGGAGVDRGVLDSA